MPKLAEVVNTGIRIREMTIDLGVEGAELDSECARFTSEVLDWATEGSTDSRAA